MTLSRVLESGFRSSVMLLRLQDFADAITIILCLLDGVLQVLSLLSCMSMTSFSQMMMYLVYAKTYLQQHFVTKDLSRSTYYLVIEVAFSRKNVSFSNESMYLTYQRRLAFLSVAQHILLYILLLMYITIRVFSSLMSLASRDWLESSSTGHHLCSRFDQPVHAAAERNSLDSCLTYLDVHQEQSRHRLTLQETLTHSYSYISRLWIYW